nr:MAG TPA: hypothetical protein [Caudoviricetes sp.]
MRKAAAKSNQSPRGVNGQGRPKSQRGDNPTKNRK